MKKRIQEAAAAAAVGTGGTVLAVGLLSRFLAERFWTAEMLINFHVQYVVTLLACLFLLVLTRRHLTAALFLIGTAFLALPVIPYVKLPLMEKETIQATGNERRYRALSYNVLQSNERTRDISDYIADQSVDFLLVIEADTKWSDEMDFELRDHFPHRFTEPRPDYQGLLFFSKLPWKSARIMSEFEDPTLEVVFDLAEGRFTFLGVHPLPPMSPRAAERRNAFLQQLADHARGLSGSVLVMGDFNTTPWSPHFQGLLHQGELSDSALGRGLQNTWYRFPMLLAGLPIDHALTRHLATLERHIGPPVGSDHRPLVLNFLLRNEGTAPMAVESPQP